MKKIVDCQLQEEEVLNRKISDTEIESVETERV
jgi:hypothetical protein